MGLAKNPWYPRFLACILGLAFILRTVNALRRPLHTDERISLQWGALPVKDMMQIVRSLDVHPPLLFLLLHVLGFAHPPDWVPRMIAVVLGTASVLMLCAIVRLWASDTAALVAGACAAVMPVLVFYDTWIRMYVLADAFVLAQFLILSHICPTKNEPRRMALLWAAWAVAVALGGYTLYLAWFATFAQGLFVLLLRRDRLAGMSASLAAAILVWLPQVPALLHQLGMGGQTFQGFHGHETSGILLLPGQVTLVPELEGTYATAAAAFAWMWTTIALVAVLLVARRTLLPWLGVPALLIFAYGIATHKLIYLDRYYIFFAYALAAWTGCLVDLALQRQWRLAVGATAVALAGVLALGVAYAVDPMFYTADWPSVARSLSQGEQPGDLVLAEQGMPYWTMPNDQDILSHEHLFIFYPNQIPKALRAARDHKRVWVIAYEPRGIDPGLTLLHQLGTSFRLVSAQPFDRYLPAENVVLLLFAR